MSFSAMAWAAKQPCKNSLTKLVLLMLANYADENNATFPSYKTLASLCECNERSVIRSIKLLYSDGLIDIENRFTASGKQTSNRFILQISQGDKFDRERVTNNAPNTITINHSSKDKREGDKYDSAFLEWWDAYPRKSGSKFKAFESWVKATKQNQYGISTISKDHLLDSTKKFAKKCVGIEDRFIPHATTWLNQRRWETVESKEVATTKNQLAG